MHLTYSIAAAIVVWLSLIVGSGEASKRVSVSYAACSVNCPPYDEDALDQLKHILTSDFYQYFRIEAGASGINPDSIAVVTDTTDCASLDSALAVVAAQADTAYYHPNRYNRAYFVGDSLYFVIEWVRQPDDPWQVATGSDYYTVFGSDFVKRAGTSL